MKIDEAIKELKSAKKGGARNIVIAWWEAGSFGRKDDRKWALACDFVDAEMDWSAAHEGIESVLRDAPLLRPRSK